MQDNIEKIKSLYSEVNDKKKFRKSVSKKFLLKESSVRVNWFSNFEIPERFGVQESLISFMEKYISKQKHVELPNKV